MKFALINMAQINKTLQYLEQDKIFALSIWPILFFTWLSTCIFFEILGRIPYIKKYRLQPNVSQQLKYEAITMSLQNWIFILFLCIMSMPFLHLIFESRPIVDNNLSTTILQLVLSFIIDDTIFYTYHRLLHSNRSLYRYHKPHHRFTAPTVWTSHAVHPVEITLQTIGGIVGPLVFGMNRQMFWLWLIIRQIQGIMDHSGLDLDPIGWIPGVAGTKFHDDHHRKIVGNYASVFSFIDDIAGTRCL